MRILDIEDKSRRVPSFLFIVALIFLGLVLRLYNLQITNSELYQNRAARNSLRTNTIKPARGKIYDKNGELLVSNTTGYQLIHKESNNISNSELKILTNVFDKTDSEREEIFSKLGKKSREKIEEIYFDTLDMMKLTNMEYEDIINKFYKMLPSGFDKVIIIDEDLDSKSALIGVEKIANPRIDILEYDKRYYHKHEVASHVLGNVKLISEKEYEELKDKGFEKDDLVGKDGIEKTYNVELKGKSGKEFVEVDARGNVLDKLDEEKAIAGKNIYLSIEYELQKYMTEQFKGKVGTFIAIDVKTGKIITYVSYPEIDLNKLSSRISKKDWEKLLNSSKRPLLNRGISGLFPPGSTAKVVSGLAILENGISPYETMYSTGEFTYGKVTFRDSNRKGHGTTNFFKAIAESVNTYFYQNILRIDRDEYFKIAKDFGIGELTGIDLPGEVSGVLPTPEWKNKRFKTAIDRKWLPGDLINMSIGQGYMLTTPLQVLMMYQAIANNGVMLKPTFIEYFENSDGIKDRKKVEILRKLNIKDKNISHLQKALRMTVTDGTAKGLGSLPVEVSSKTGTAQNRKEAKHHSWMAGYFPSNNPEIAFVALVEEGGYGAVEAGGRVYEFISKYYELKGEN
ncbi:penicillin-binding protein 2 [Streptobacillus moniliformis]|uniref:penicillin-binding protein 2 n=1 Tax=Streptobacillus moniliformis TaxID=34105 RepID=UPI0007E3462D|nr:penicillin-binding protein 2 [Streptobacillus moniliformis]